MALRQPGKESSDVRNGIPYRRLGRTGEMVSLIGVGGYHLGRQADERETIRIVRAAVDGGINFLDNCWTTTVGRASSAWGRRCDRHRDGRRMPSLCHEPADERGDYRLRFTAGARAGAARGPQLSPAERGGVAALLKRTAHAGRDGKYELYKTTHHFDGTYQNPQWLG